MKNKPAAQSALFPKLSNKESMCQRMALLEGIAKGEQAIQQGHIMINSQARIKMAKWLK